MNYNHRIAAVSDAPEIFALLRSLIGTPGCTWNEHYPSIEKVEGDISRGDCYVLTDGEKIVASGTIEPGDYVRGVECFDDTPKNWRTIGRIAVDKSLHGRGIGAVIVNLLTEEAAARNIDALRLLVGEHNGVAQRLYEKCGFKKCGELYAFDVQWVCMEKLHIIGGNDV